MSQVYFIFEQETDLCKIGKSVDPDKRVKQLQTGNPRELELYATIPGSYDIERKLHELNAESHKRGEWFNLSRETVDEIVENFQVDDELWHESSESVDEIEEEEADEPDVIIKNVHVKTITTTSYGCDKCGRTFSAMRYLKIHKNKKIPCDKRLICEKCDREFTTVSNYNKHLNRKTPCGVQQADNPDNRCDRCNSPYSSKSNLTRHQKTCTAEPPQPSSLEGMITFALHQQQRLFDKLHVLENQITASQAKNNSHTD